MNVRDYMQHSVISASPHTSLALAWRLMQDHHIRHLPVLSDTQLVGLITDRDIRSASPSTAAALSQAEIVYHGVIYICPNKVYFSEFAFIV